MYEYWRSAHGAPGMRRRGVPRPVVVVCPLCVSRVQARDSA
jgi:hypothetical protein